MVAEVEQEGRGWWRRWSRRAEDGGTGGTGGQRMVAQVEHEGREWWHRWSRRAENGGAAGAGGKRMVEQEGRGWLRTGRTGGCVEWRAPTPAGTSVFTKHNCDMGIGYLWLNGWGI